MSQFYSRLSQSFLTRVGEIKDNIFNDKYGERKTFLYENYGEYWGDFCNFWIKERGEQLDWDTFVLRRHNADYFLQWLYKKHPKLLKNILSPSSKE